jgi:hypothetical protein
MNIYQSLSSLQNTLPCSCSAYSDYHEIPLFTNAAMKNLRKRLRNAEQKILLFRLVVKSAYII